MVIPIKQFYKLARYIIGHQDASPRCFIVNSQPRKRCSHGSTSRWASIQQPCAYLALMMRLCLRRILLLAIEADHSPIRALRVTYRLPPPRTNVILGGIIAPGHTVIFDLNAIATIKSIQGSLNGRRKTRCVDGESLPALAVLHSKQTAVPIEDRNGGCTARGMRSQTS